MRLLRYRKENAFMLKLNHLNLPCSNVAEFSRFFVAGFGFRETFTVGLGKIAQVVGEDGFELLLMYDKRLETQSYPTMFHAGFVVGSKEEVDLRYRRIVEAGFEAPAPALIRRGGPPAYGFYCTPPGGVMVEVSTGAV
jgi:catechol 2,3-dioxygenase-like lactoylglutathione lyase family enzyme